MKKHSMLSQLNIAAPCTSSWEKMTGNEQVRFCHECKLNVYNLSNMSESEAEELVREKEGRLCVRFYRRKDGTVLTDNCPVGLRMIRDYGRKLATILAIAASWLMTYGNQQAIAGERKWYRTFTESVREPVMMGAPAVPDSTNGPVIKTYITLPINSSSYYRELVDRISLKWHKDNGPILLLEIANNGDLVESTIVKGSGTSTIDNEAIEVVKSVNFCPLPESYRKADKQKLFIDFSTINKAKNILKPLENLDSQVQ